MQWPRWADFRTVGLKLPVSSKCLFEVWLFNKDVTDDKIGMIAMRLRIFGGIDYSWLLAA